MDEWSNCSLKGLTKGYVIAGASGKRAVPPASMPGHAGHSVQVEPSFANVYILSLPRILV